MPTPIRPIFLRYSGFPPIMLLLTGLLILFAASLLALRAWEHYHQSGYIPMRQAPLIVSISSDKRVVCYAMDGAMSCMPTWLLDAPQSWFAVYTKPEKGKTR